MTVIPFYLLAVDNEEDRAFLSALYFRYQKRMFYYAYKKTGSRHETEDAIQDTMTALTEKVSQIQQYEEQHLEGYIFSTLKNCLLLRYRNKHSLCSLEEDIPDEESPPEERILVSESVEEVTEALRQLDDESQMIINMKYFQRIKDSDIAKALNMSSGALRCRLTRIRKKLRMILSVEKG